MLDIPFDSWVFYQFSFINESQAREKENGPSERATRWNWLLTQVTFIFSSNILEDEVPPTLKGQTDMPPIWKAPFKYINLIRFQLGLMSYRKEQYVPSSRIQADLECELFKLCILDTSSTSSNYAMWHWWCISSWTMLLQSTTVILSF